MAIKRKILEKTFTEGKILVSLKVSGEDMAKDISSNKGLFIFLRKRFGLRVLEGDAKTEHMKRLEFF